MTSPEKKASQNYRTSSRNGRSTTHVFFAIQ